MKISSLLRKFSKDKKGSTAISLGLTFTMIAGATIGAIEIEQMQKTRNIMQDKLDATILYLGNTKYKTSPQQAGEAYFRSTIESTDLDLISMNPVFVYDDASGNITGTVDFEIKGLMTGGLVPDKTLQIEAVATPKTTGTVEISMVLDVSGSMGWTFSSQNNGSVGQRRIDGLFEAADAMFKVIYQNPKAVPAVAVIPYATSVDITDQFAATETSERSIGFEGHDVYANRWHERLGGKRLEDLGMLWGGPTLASVTTADVKERDHAETMAVYAAERYSSQNSDGSYTIKLDEPNAQQQIPVYTETQSGMFNTWRGLRKVSNYNGRLFFGGKEEPYQGIMPMTKDLNAVQDYVKAFKPKGGTAGHIGAAWGLYALTPAWGGFFDHPAGTPQSFDETTEKYLVFMSDGQFNSQKDPDMSTNDMYNYFQSVCSKAREKGVRVFTVGLLLDTRTEEELSECAGDTGAFYPVDNRLQLVEAFRSIGRETGELRLSH
jgi:Flp pilus assembly protein TadG